MLNWQTGDGVTRRGAAVAAIVAVGAVVQSCASPGAPPGGPEDFLPPQVVETFPDTFAVVESLTDPVRIGFNERISERPAQGSLSRAVLVSPRSGDVQVRTTRSGLEVRVDGGFQRGQVYRVTVLPVLRDMFGNTMREAFELVFSTGPPPVPNVIAGIVTDRITGRAVGGTTVLAVPVDAGIDAPVHIAATDSAGIYALRFIPAGDYDVQAFFDTNLNRVADRAELRSSTRGLVAIGDTILADMRMLAPDTTPARLVSATAEAGDVVQFTFDDFLDPDASLDASVASVSSEGGADPVGVLRTLHDVEWVAFAALRADTTADVSAEAIRASIAGAGDEALPSQSVFLVLSDTLAFDTPYSVTIRGVPSIGGAEGGGGEATVTRVLPVVADSTGVLPDTSQVRGGILPPDSGRVERLSLRSRR